jgi:hypothetical protein
MRCVTYAVAIATLAGAVAGCAESSYPGYGYPHASSRSGYNYPASGYNYPANYGSYSAGSGYYQNGYGSSGDYNRNYGGTRSGPQVTFTLPN